jgi:hypothetical protein
MTKSIWIETRSLPSDQVGLYAVVDDESETFLGYLGQVSRSGWIQHRFSLNPFCRTVEILAPKTKQKFKEILPADVELKVKEIRKRAFEAGRLAGLKEKQNEHV